MTSKTQLWTDERIAAAVKAVAHNDLPDMRSQSVTAFRAEQLMGQVRHEYETLINQLEAEAKQMLPDGYYLWNATHDNAEDPLALGVMGGKVFVPSCTETADIAEISDGCTFTPLVALTLEVVAALQYAEVELRIARHATATHYADVLRSVLGTGEQP